MKKISSLNHSFQLNDLYCFFEQDEWAIKEFLKVVLKDFITIKHNLESAIDKGDIVLYKDSFYKMQPTLKLLKANHLQNLLVSGKKRLVLGKSGATNTLFVELKKVFSSFLTSLQEVLVKNKF